MDVLFTFPLKEELKQPLIQRFPELRFTFSTIDDPVIEQASIIVTYGEDVTKETLERANHLKWIMVASAGVEKMPIEEMRKRQIPMANVSGIHKTPMAEAVLAHILAQARALPTIYERQEKKEWNKKIQSTELRDKTALILGPGAIGQEIGRLLQAFHVRTIGCNYSGEKRPYMDNIISFKQLEQYIDQADFFISVVPSTKETRGMITKQHFQKMKSTAYFLNFGRGDLVKEADLIWALENNEIARVILDVYEEEPLSTTSPLWSLKGCTVSPHVSSFSGKYLERAMPIIEENISRYLEGRNDFINKIDLTKEY